MIDPALHAPLRLIPWNADAAATAIEEIVAQALADFRGDGFWPSHPMDGKLQDGDTSFYFGAAGMIWGIEYLKRVGATKADLDFRSILPRLLGASKAELPGYKDYSAHGSLLFGDMGTALVVMRLAPSAAVADFVYERADANTTLPVRELMWGMPGSMLACVHMAEITGQPRWRSLFAVQAARLLDELEDGPDGPIWTQDLYGQHVQYLGPAHGYAGNMIPLMRGWNWLVESQRARVAAAVPATLAANAWLSSELGTTWRAFAGVHTPPRLLCQHCHGAPGIVTTFADAPFSSPELEELLLDGGKFTWTAGPLAKGSNLCHGTGGNGYPFLKLYRRTKNSIWLERARAFAMTAIAQCREAKDELGRGRYSLWTGDIGLAIYLRDCLTADPYFPSIDVF